MVLPNVKRETLQYEILNNVEFGAKLYRQCRRLQRTCQHLRSRRGESCGRVREGSRTHQRSENFWSFSSAAARNLRLLLNLFISFAMSMSKCFVTTIVHKTLP